MFVGYVLQRGGGGYQPAWYIQPRPGAALQKTTVQQCFRENGPSKIASPKKTELRTKKQLVCTTVYRSYILMKNIDNGIQTTEILSSD